MPDCLHEPVLKEHMSLSALSVHDYLCPGAPRRCAEEIAIASEIVLPRHGVFVRRNRFGRGLADPTSIMLFDRNDPFEVEHPVQQRDTSTVLSLSDKFVDELRTLPGQELSPFFELGVAPITPTIAMAHHNLLSTVANDIRAKSIEVEEKALLLLAEIFKHLQEVSRIGAASKNGNYEKSKSPGYAIANEAALFLNKNFKERLLLENIATYVDCSPYYLCRAFKNWTGRTIHQHITELRMSAALELLRNSRRSITEIALELGYSSHSHFTAMFGKVFGITPKSFRILK